jgi:hypothetical protein
MALSTIQANNKLVQYRKDIIREFVRENMFSPYMGDSMTSIIRTIYDPKKGGEQINIPLVTKLTNTPAGAADTLVGAEEAIDNYGMRVWVDWARQAVSTNDAEEQKDSADVFGEAKPLLSDWGKELQRDELIAAFMALPSESAPANLGGSSGGQRVNGVLFEASTTAQIDAWVLANRDRVLFGNDVSHLESDSDWSDSVVKIEPGTDKCTKNSISLMKRLAKNSNPRIRPYRSKDGYEYFVGFAGSLSFRDIKASLSTDNQQAFPRGKDNPIFQDGDLLWDGVIIREVPEIDYFVDNVWTSANADNEGFLATAGATSSRVAPVFLCGQSAASLAWAQMPTPTFRQETDYQFIKGAGVKMCYGAAKTFTKVGSNLKQWGVFTGLFSAAADTTVS